MSARNRHNLYKECYGIAKKAEDVYATILMQVEFARAAFDLANVSDYDPQDDGFFDFDTLYSSIQEQIKASPVCQSRWQDTDEDFLDSLRHKMNSDHRKHVNEAHVRLMGALHKVSLPSKDRKDSKSPPNTGSSFIAVHNVPCCMCTKRHTIVGKRFTLEDYPIRLLVAKQRLLLAQYFAHNGTTEATQASKIGKNISFQRNRDLHRAVEMRWRQSENIRDHFTYDICESQFRKLGDSEQHLYKCILYPGANPQELTALSSSKVKFQRNEPNDTTEGRKIMNSISSMKLPMKSVDSNPA